MLQAKTISGTRWYGALAFTGLLHVHLVFYLKLLELLIFRLLLSKKVSSAAYRGLD